MKISLIAAIALVHPVVNSISINNQDPPKDPAPQKSFFKPDEIVHTNGNTGNTQGGNTDAASDNAAAHKNCLINKYEYYADKNCEEKATNTTKAVDVAGLNSYL